MRAPLALVTAVAAVAAVACSAGTHPAAPSVGAGSSGSAAAAIRVPGCTTATASAPTLRRVPTALTPVPSEPFGVAVTADGRWAFVAFNWTGAVGVFRIGGSVADNTLVRQVIVGGQPSGEALTPDGRYLLVTKDSGATAVVSVSRAEQGGPGAVVGTLNDPAGTGSIEAAVSPDGRFAFVSLEGSDAIAVFNLQRALAAGFARPALVGTIPVGLAPVGLAVSPDGRWLYATSESATASSEALSGIPTQGTVTVIDLDRAETDPRASVLATADAGCSPVRVIVSPDGRVVWVTARGSDSLLGFSAARLVTRPAHALIASVRVGETPVGLALVDRGTRIVVADSNRFAPSGPASLAVVGVGQALAARPALLGYLQTYGFPREMALEPGGRVLLVTHFYAEQLQAVDVARLP